MCFEGGGDVSGSSLFFWGGGGGLLLLPRVNLILNVCRFKMKVGKDLKDDIRRAEVFRRNIGYDKIWV